MSDIIRIVPSHERYKSAPYLDQTLTIGLEGESKLITEYDRSSLVDLATLYDNERQTSTKMRPTLKLNYIYNNTYTGVTNYFPFVNNLYYVNPLDYVGRSTWGGFPQYFEFDIFRPKVDDGHITYVPKSGYNYNWMFYFTYPYENDYERKMSYNLNNSSYNWKAKEGIPFKIKMTSENGNNIISFECIMEHGLTPGESVELSISYGITNVFEVYSIGNGEYDSEKFIFNIFNIGYTGSTFYNGLTGTFKRVINPTNQSETTSKYYVRKHKVIYNSDEIIITKNAYEKNPFNEDLKLELSPLTPNNTTRISKKNSSNSYNVTLKKDIDLALYIDNQNRPLSELFLTIINKGFSGYFNKPNNNGVALKEGWGFNITENTNSWWDNTNSDSDSNITTSNYTKTNPINLTTKTFYYNNNLNVGDSINGDYCEWNDYEQKERVISRYYHKLKYNQDNFLTDNTQTTNPKGFYYSPHNSVTIRVFSQTIETVSLELADQVPNWSYYSKSDGEFRWRDLYDVGFIDENLNGIDYPFLNDSHYPFSSVIFKLISEGSNFNNNNLGINVAYKPKIDECE